MFRKSIKLTNTGKEYKFWKSSWTLEERGQMFHFCFSAPVSQMGKNIFNRRPNYFELTMAILKHGQKIKQVSAAEQTVATQTSCQLFETCFIDSISYL